MDLITTITFDQIGLAFLAVFTIREAMLFLLPDNIAGPGGRFIDTECVDFEP